MTTSIYQEDPFLSARMAEFESQDAALNPFRLCIEKLEGEVDRSERDGVCSREVAKAARQEIEELTSEMECLILKKIEIHRRISAPEKATSNQIPRNSTSEIRFSVPVNVPNTRASKPEPVYFRSEHRAKIWERDFFGTRKGRKEAGRKIDPETAEVDYFYVPRIEYDIYDMRGFYEEVRNYFARSPGSSIWVRFEDLPDETRNKLGQKIDAGVACWPKPEWEDGA